MAASMINTVSLLLRNACKISHDFSSSLKGFTKPLSPWQQCSQVRSCSDKAEPIVNHQKRMLSWPTNRDWNHRKLVLQYGQQRQRLNAIRRNKILPQEIKDLASAEIHALPKRSSITHTHPRCVLTGKSRGRVKRWRLSRIQWRLFADYNNLSGVTRAMW